MAAGLVEDLLAALERRRADGRLVAATDAAAACVERLTTWGARRVLCPDDPVIDRLDLPRVLDGHGLEVVVWPAERPWRDLLGLDDAPATCAITVPRLAVAQRGTLLIEASPRHGRSMDAVGWWHLALLPSDRIVATLAEALVQTYADRVPSALSLVSGPSRTSDIEKITTYGAHGALAEHVVVVDAMSV